MKGVLVPWGAEETPEITTVFTPADPEATKELDAAVLMTTALELVAAELAAVPTDENGKLDNDPLVFKTLDMLGA